MATAEEKLKFLNDSKDDTILLFTNGRGEPRAINVDRCIEELDGSANPAQVWTNSGLIDFDGLGLDVQAHEDFIAACPRVPLLPISFEFFKDPSKSSRSFEYVDGIQFSYQVVYKNGSTSAIAPYSDVAYPPQISSLGTKRISEVSVDNACRLFIPFVGLEARSVRIIAREGNDGQPRVVDDLFVGFDTSVSDFSNSNVSFSAEYIFYNDKVGTILSQIDSEKNFDNVPRDAKSQTVADNRVMYGNYTEGYPNIITDANLTVEFDEAPPPGFTFELKVEPYLFIKPATKVDRVSDIDLDGKRYKTNTGFIVDTTDFPETIPVGRYTISVSVTPQNNYHVYLGRGDDAIVRRSFGSAGTSLVDDSYTEGNATIVGSPGSASNANPGALFNSARSRQIGKYGIGVGGGSNTPSMACSYMNGSTEADSGDFWRSSDSGGVDYGDVGGAYSSPLIIKGEPINLQTTIKVDAPTSREIFSQSIIHGLCGLNPNSSPISGFGSQESPSFTVEEHFKEYDIDLSNDIYQGSSFDSDSELADLITSWSRHRENFSFFGNEPFTEATQHPEGFFILTEGTVRFVFEPAKSYAGNSSLGSFIYNLDDTEGYGVIMSFAHVENAVCKTVIPTPQYNWGASASPNAATNTINNIIGQGLFPGDPLNERRAARYQATGTSQWSVRYEQGDPKLTWPGCVRQWETPDGALNGPACLQHANPQEPCYGENVNGFNLSGSVAPVGNFGVGQVAPNIVPGDTRYHPAPIGRWFCLGGESDEVKPSDLDSGFFEGLTQSGNLFKVAFDVPSSGGQSPSDYIRVGSPNEMLGAYSKYYQGEVAYENRFEDGRLYFRLGRDIKYELPDPSQTVQTYKERGTLSVIDGNGGVGGARDYGANSFGDREDNSIWGNPLYSGYHSSSSFELNGIGRMANSRGVVTNFSLLGHKDNCANLANQEVWSRNKQTLTGASFEFLDSIFDSYYQTGWANPRSERIRVNRDFSVGSPSHYANPFGYQPIGSSYTAGDTRGGLFYATLSNVVPGIDGTLIRSASPSNAYNGPSVSVTSKGITSNTARAGLTSFKTKANHEFGLVYFDERGRHGAVQTIDSIYVPGYDEVDRPNDPKGAASIKIDIFHRPPSWAKSYKVVYAGNTSIREFTQYSSGKAFVPDSGPNKNRIYLSLNHLQGNEASYAESYGAISQDDGSKNIYRFAEGDRLRIIMYGEPTSGGVVYTPDEFDFRVVDFVVLDPDQDEHPFGGDAQNNPQLNGQFLVLEDNESADGFTVQNVVDEIDLWGNRCIFEVYSPFSALSAGARTYYETNYGGRVISSADSAGTLTHEFNTIIVDQGDVFFRAVPTNVQTIDSGSFVQLIPDLNTDSANSNFVAYFLETEGVTDLYESKAKNYGRTHFVDRFADEVKRPSSISFSEQTPLGSFDLRYFSFPQIGNFKDLPPVTGEIDKMSFEGTHIMSFNNSKLYRIPVGRDALTVSGVADDAIVSSAKVLGTEVAIDFDGGSSGRPESVISINNDFFFFDALNERIVMIQGGRTPVVITDSQINSYFRDEVKKWKERGAFKAPSGYDPTRSEFLFTLHDRGDSIKFFDVSGTDESAETKMITIAFDLKSKKYWKSRYTFSTPHYSKLNESMVSFHKDLGGVPSLNGEIVINPWVHEKNAPKNNFFGRPSRSNICIASNQDPSKVKEYDVVILDSDAVWDAKLYTKDGYSTIPKTSWKRYNDKWYAPIPGTTPGFGEVGQEIDKKGSAETTINTAPFSSSEFESLDGEITNILYPGPKRFKRVLPDPFLPVEIEMKIQVPLSASSYLTSLPIGKGTSKLYESEPSSTKMLPLGLLGSNAHVFDRGAYVYSEEEGDGLTYSNLIVRMPEKTILNYCLNNGYQDVFDRLDALPNDPEFEFVLDQSQNDVTGHRIFDIVFAPFYSMQFGITAEQQGTLDNIIADIEEEDLEGITPTQFDLNGDGFVDVDDFAVAADALATQDLAADFNGDGLVTGADLAILYGYVDTPVGEPSEFLNNITLQLILNRYNATRKNIHSAYVKLLNPEPLTGRYMKVDLVSDNEDNEDELFEVGVDFNARVKSISNVSKRPTSGSPKRRAK